MARRLSREQVEAIYQNPRVLAALRARGRRVLPRAQRLASQAGAEEFARALRLTTGIRPGAKAVGGIRRPYVRIGAELTEEQVARDSGARLTRRQILRRASNA